MKNLLKQIKHLIDYANTPKHSIETLTIYFIIHASISYN